MSLTKIGIIGAGWWATENHIPVLQALPDVQVAYICGVGREQLERIQRKFGIPSATENYEELLECEDLDGVIVSSPHGLHYRHAVAALKRGLPVLCEKPMTLKSSEAKHLAELVEAKDLPFMVPYGWNYTELATMARKAIHQGAVGDVEHVLCHMGSPLRDLLSGTGAWVAEGSPNPPEKGTWSDPSAGGGFLNGQLTHALALMFWITDLRASEVFAMVGRSESGSDLYSSISCRFSNGATGMLGGAGTVPPRSPFQVDIRIFGSQGMLLLDVERPRFEIRNNDGSVWSPPVNQTPGGYACVEPLKVFVELIQGKAVENRSPVGLGRRVVDILDASSRSAASSKIESISPRV
jgi:predicted dehydrogenase